MYCIRMPALALAMFLIPACTELKVYKVDADHADGQDGTISYALPKKTLVVSATYVLKSCSTRLDIDTQKPALVLEMDVTATLAGVNELDSDERYYLSYSDLRNWLKETNVIVESHATTRTLKSFSGTINDQAGAILTAGISTAVKLSALAATSAAKQAVEYCEAKTKNALTELNGYKTLLASIVGGSGDSAPDPKAAKQKPKAAAGKPDKPATAGAEATPQSEESKNARAQEVQKKIAALVAEKLTSKYTWTWTPALGDLNSVWAQGYEAAVAELTVGIVARPWLSKEGLNWLAGNPDSSQSIFMLVYVPTWAVPANKVKESPIAAPSGVVLRDPAIGSVRLCKGECKPPQSGVTYDNNLLASVSGVALPQLGRRRIMPLKNEIGQNSVLDITMSEDGVLTKVGLHSTSNIAKTISDLGSAADTAKSAAEARAKAAAAAASAAQTKTKDDNKLVADCLEAQKTILKDGGIPIGSCQ